MLAYGAARVGIGMHDLFFNALAGFYLVSYGLPNWAIGFLANERSFLGALLSPWVGTLSDRARTPLGRRMPFILATAPLAVAGLLVLSLWPPLPLMVVVVLLEPIFLGLAVVPYQSLLPDCVVPQQRATVSGVNVLLGMAGGMALLVAAKFWWETHPAWVFLLTAGTLAGGFLLTLATVHEPAAPPAEAPGHKVALADLGDYVRGLLAYREAAKYVGSYFLFWAGIGGITPFVTRFGHEELGIPEGDTFLLLLAVLVATLAFSAPAGWLGDHYGKKRVSSWGLLVFGLLVLVGSQTQTLTQALVLLTLAGLAQAVPSVLAYPLFTELVPARRMGELTGLSVMIWSLAQPLGATALGAVADQVGSLRAVLFGGGLAILASWAVLQTVQVRPVADAEPC